MFTFFVFLENLTTIESNPRSAISTRNAQRAESKDYNGFPNLLHCFKELQQRIGTEHSGIPTPNTHWNDDFFDEDVDIDPEGIFRIISYYKHFIQAMKLTIKKSATRKK